MDVTLQVQIKQQIAYKFLQDLEELDVLKVLDKPTNESGVKLSEKLKGAFTKEDAESFMKHINEVRNEWDNI